MNFIKESELSMKKRHIKEDLKITINDSIYGLTRIENNEELTNEDKFHSTALLFVQCLEALNTLQENI